MRNAVLAALALLLSSSVAAAQAPGETMAWDPEEPPSQVQPGQPVVEPQPTTTTVSYRKQVLAADAVSLGLIIAGPMLAHENGGGISALGATGYLLAAPGVHLSHGRYGAAAKSLALRAGLPLAGAVIGYRLGPQDVSAQGAPDPEHPGQVHDNDGGSLAGMLLGFFAGGVTAIVVDAKYLARYETKPATPTWSASFRHTQGGMTVGINGSF